MRINTTRRFALAFASATALSTAMGIAAVAAADTPTFDIATEFRRTREIGAIQIPNSLSSARVPSSHVPRPASAPLGVGPGASLGFDGVNFVEHRTADGGNQFSLEPPDPATCVGNERVVSAVNTTFSVHDARTGARVGGPISLNRFFYDESQIVRGPPATYGRFVADPKCFYDPTVRRFVMTLLSLDQDPTTRAFTGESDVLVAVSKGSTPTVDRSQWWIYKLAAQNDGGSETPGIDHPGCPCLPDQPLVGFDEHGIYVTTNEFSLAGPEFNGAQIYAIDKTEALAGTLDTAINGPDVQLLGGTPIPLAEGPAYSLQPATVPPGEDFEAGAGGTEYLLSALDFDGTLDNRIAVWALTNTASLATDDPEVELSAPAVLTSQVYGQPPDAQQKPGPTPLGDLAPFLFAGKPQGVREKVNLLAGNDDRMQMVTLADGKLWSSLNTVVKTENGPVRIGAAWFVVDPAVSSTGAVSGVVVEQGYVSRENENVMFPAVGVNSEGQGAMVFTLVGPDRFPSAAYVPISASGTGPIHVLRGGSAPADGFTGYTSLGGNRTERWGDYHAAFADEEGDIWVTAQYIAGSTFPFLANWSTWVAEIDR